VAKVDVMAEEKDEQQLANIFLLLIAVEGFVSFEFAPYIGQLLVYAFNLRLFAFTCGLVWKWVDISINTENGSRSKKGIHSKTTAIRRRKLRFLFCPMFDRWKSRLHTLRLSPCRGFSPVHRGAN